MLNKIIFHFLKNKSREKSFRLSYLVLTIIFAQGKYNYDDYDSGYYSKNLSNRIYLLCCTFCCTDTMLELCTFFRIIFFSIVNEIFTYCIVYQAL